MRLGIKHPLIHTIMFDLPNIILHALSQRPFPANTSPYSTYRRMNQIAILQHLSKQKAILEIRKPAPAHRIHVPQLREPAADATGRVDGHERVPRPVAVDLVARCAVRVVEGLDDFGAEHVVAGCDVEAGALVEGCLVCGRRRVVGVVGGCGGSGPAEDFGADAGERRDVRVVAAVDEGEAEVNVFLLLERESA